ncbi:MAG: MaoC family dehydratase, partial [Acidimicrobiia bacterium]
VSSDRAGTLFINRASLYLRGEGGFSPEAPHEQGPPPTTPPTSPDKVVEMVTLPQQALLYRLSGDKNPLHADPQMAALAGFDRPILHGLCSFGIACKAVVDAMLDGEPDRVTAYSARFAGVAFPGETLVVSMWTQPNEILLVASTKERSSPVLVNGLIRLAV